MTIQRQYTYSCRVEHWSDAVRFLRLLSRRPPGPNELVLYDGTCDGLEFRTALDRAGVLALLARVPYAHVMEETLRECPLAENSRERSYDDAALADR